MSTRSYYTLNSIIKFQLFRFVVVGSWHSRLSLSECPFNSVSFSSKDQGKRSEYNTRTNHGVTCLVFPKTEALYTAGGPEIITDQSGIIRLEKFYTAMT